MRIVLLIIFLSSSFTMLGQFNFKVGYDLAYNRPNALNDIIDNYNKENPELEDKMGRLRFSGGLELGLRYGIGNSALEASFSSMSKSHEALGINPIDESDIQLGMFYSFTRYSLGYQYLFGKFGYGVSVSRRKTRIRTSVDGSDIKLTLAQQSNYATKVFLMFEVPGLKKMRFNLIPYIEFPHGDMNIAPVEDRILNNPQNTGVIKDSFPVMGVSFVFYNGPRG